MKAFAWWCKSRDIFRMDSVCLPAKHFSFFIVVIVILGTLRGHEIFKFTFKSWTCTEKRDNEQKSLKLDCGREVSSEVNSYSTHLPIVAFTAPQGHDCFEYCTYKHRHALPQMGEHSRPLSRENIWALWLFFYSVHWWKRVIMYSLKRRLRLRGKQLRLTLLSLKCFPWKNPFCFQTIRGNTHLYDCNLCAFFFFC